MGWIDGMKFENGDESFFLVFQKLDKNDSMVEKTQ